eukprot:4482585-Amphidinium_carterae.1
MELTNCGPSKYRECSFCLDRKREHWTGNHQCNRLEMLHEAGNFKILVLSQECTRESLWRATLPRGSSGQRLRLLRNYPNPNVDGCVSLGGRATSATCVNYTNYEL